MMKSWVKIFVILGLLPLFFACTTNNKQNEEKFVNPIFYQTLFPYSAGTGCAKLTPTTLYLSFNIRYDCDKWLNKDLNSPEKTDTYNCKLIKNTEKELIYSCGKYIEKFTIATPEEVEELFHNRNMILINHKRCKKKFPDICGGASYIIK